MGMITPCNKCTIGKTYYEHPCSGCIHNPRTPEEILESHREELFKQRHDRFTAHKSSFDPPESELLETDGQIEFYRCGSCKKKFMTVTGTEHKAHHCPSCGQKIKYGGGLPNNER